MCVPNASMSLVSLNLNDIPVGYKPQKGPDVYVRLSYDHLDTVQPASPNYGNLGPRWSYGFQSYVTDDPTTPGSQVTRYARGGGQVDYSYEAGTFNSTTGAWGAELQGAAVLQRNPASGTLTSYSLTMPDGSVQTFGQPDGSSSYPRRVFLTGVTDPQGNSLSLSYDASNRLTSVQDAEGRSTTFCYDPTRSSCSTYSGSSMLISQITDPFGRSAVLSYDSYGRLSSIQDVLGITSSFTYDSAPGADAGADGGAPGDAYFINALTTPYGVSSFSGGQDFSTESRWLELTDPDGNTERVEYMPSATGIGATESSTPSGMTVENGHYDQRNTFYWNKYVYPTYGTGSGKDYTKAQITHWTENINGGTAPIVASIKKPLENRVYYTYPGQDSVEPQFTGTYNQPAAIGRVLDDSTSQVSTFTYNAAGKLTEAVDPLGRDTKYCYDSGCTTTNSNIDLLTVKQLTASSTYTATDTYTYDSTHDVLTHTDAAGQEWRYCYNSAGQITQAIDPANYSSGSSCGSYGTSGTLYSYDGTGRLTTITNAAGNTQLTNTYPSSCSSTGGVNCDLPSSVTDSEGRTVSYTRDALDRVTTTTYPDGTTDVDDWTFQSGSYSGTPSLEIRKHTDRLSRVTTYGYDNERRLTSTTDPLSHSVSYTYFADGTLNTQTDQNSHTTTWAIDVQSRPTTKTFPDSSVVTTAYENTTSRVKSITDALSQVKTYGYDESNEVTSINYTTSGSDAGLSSTPNVSFTWDTYFPRRTQMVDGIGTTNWTYVAIGTNGALKLATDDGPFSGTVDKQTIAYDADGRPNSLTIDSLSAETWSYDALGRPTSHVTSLGTWTNTFLGQTLRMASRTLGSTGVSTSWSYDSTTNDQRLTGITNAATGVSPGPRSYTFGYGTAADGGGPQNPYDIMNSTQTAGGGASWASQNWSYAYDNDDRLTSAVGSVIGTYSYAYDAAGNTTTFTTNNPPSSTSPTFNSLNEMASNGSLTPTYDSNGNSTSQGRSHQSYTFDAENRILSLTIPPHFPIAWTESFQYDGLGRRLISGFAIGGSPTYTHWLWMGGRLLEQRNSSDTVEKLYYPEGEYYQQTGKKAAYFPDQIGSVRDTDDVAGTALLYSADYTPYGLQTPGWTASGNYFPDIRFAGMFTESNSAELLTPARLYEAAEGRFMQRDPLGYQPGPNLYAYAGGNPISNLDPSGLQGIPGALVRGVAWAWGQASGSASLLEGLPQTAVLGSLLSIGGSTPQDPCANYPDLPICQTPQQQAQQCGGASFANNRTLVSHFNAHGADFGASTPLQYEQQASSFLTGNPSTDVVQSIRANGDIVRFNPVTDEFGVVSDTGTIRTYFKPDPSVHGFPTNLDYFHAQ